jgi:hypothetical protein
MRLSNGMCGRTLASAEFLIARSIHIPYKNIQYSSQARAKPVWVGTYSYSSVTALLAANQHPDLPLATIDSLAIGAAHCRNQHIKIR